MHWDTFERAAKIIGVSLSLGGLIVWVAGRAAASDVADNKKEIAVIKAEQVIVREYDLEWKKWAGERLGQISVQVKAPVEPPPPPPRLDGGAR